MSQMEKAEPRRAEAVHHWRMKRSGRPAVKRNIVIGGASFSTHH